MSNASISYLSTLPVEILHRIFDNLDELTIRLSLRITCQRLKAIADNYERYRLDSRFVSRSNFQLLCRLIDPRRVNSLTLAPTDETLDQIELFTTCFRARQFNRLRLLTLINIEENQLKFILKRVDCSSLTSFSLNIGRRDRRCENTSVSLLSSIITQANLSYLDIDISNLQVEKLAWPPQCGIRYLKINYSFEWHHLLTILRSLPHLQTLNVKALSSANPTITERSSSSTSFPQITSVILEGMGVNTSNVEFLISLMPSLTHLKVTGSGDLWNGNRWEQFIQTNLPFLNRLELFVTIYKTQDVQVDIESIIASFQTPFWLEHKKWYFTCEHIYNWRERFLLYSLPFCESTLTYIPESRKASLSSFDPLLTNTVSIMDNVNTFILSATNFESNEMDQLLEIQRTPSNAIFRKVTKLEVEYNTTSIPNWIPLIFALIDLKTVVEIKLTGTWIFKAKPNVMANLANLIQQACNLISLEICSQYSVGISEWTAEEIYAITPSHLKHLTTSFASLNEAKIALERLQNLSTARFYYRSDPSGLDSFVEWLEQNRPNSTHVERNNYTKIWFGHHSIQSTRVTTGNKRIKLTDEHHNS